ncbi:PD-(D/E)XK nuclease family protein [Legionella sp.]|uniref:PD-(D/E)XK nuclease family protein n=1 Tax=Legionella sp. TaxID=459 RepID=UPI003C871454
MHIFNDKEHLFALLAKGVTVITPNNRLSESLLEYYFNFCTSKTVQKPTCLPYQVVLIKAYEQLNFINSHSSHPLLLNNTQCHHLWRNIIKSHAQITYSEGLLHSVLSAWERCEQWQVNPQDPEFHYTSQTRQFQQWWQFFDNQLKQQNFITECQLATYLVNANSMLLSQPVVWVCFDDFNPQQLRLQQHLEQHGLKQYYYDLKEHPPIAEVFAAKDDKEEYQQLMIWLQKKLHSGNQRISVVVPDLQQKSPELQRILAQHFNPTLFNISLGQPLSTFPLIAHALCWLNLDTKSLNHHQASLILQSPYLGGAQEEFLARSEYLQDGSLLEKQNILFTKFIHDLEVKTPKLAALLTQVTPYPLKTSVLEWIHLFQERLNSLGFPGDYGLISENYQCFNRFTLLFDEFRQLSLLNSQFTKTEALETLQLLANKTIFQAQKINAAIQISGLLEASGCEFDHLWVMGLTDQCLPQKVHLSAFIPPLLQRELCMPHSLPTRELQFARQTVHRLQNSAGSVVFSYAELQGDTSYLPCSLIAKLPSFAPLPMNTESVLHNELIHVEELYNVPLKLGEHISGGTSILANQAKCPFKAFAEHRLRAKAVSYTTDGLDTKERGQIIHKVMELLWHELESQHALFSLDEQIVEQHINQAIHRALAPLTQQQPESFSKFIHEVEYTRLKRLVLSYLEWEKQRPPFTIAALEQSYAINLAGLELQVRVDRLDQVADKKWVIDYKSSLPNNKPWNEDRPKEPQLLLYALLDTQINALLFVQLKTGKISCSGFSEEKQGISGISSLRKEETWTNCRENWQAQLTRLAEEFQQGHCPPQPTQMSLCQQCDYQNLCRFQTNE